MAGEEMSPMTAAPIFTIFTIFDRFRQVFTICRKEARIEE